MSNGILGRTKSGKESKGAPRTSLADYGLTEERCRELAALVCSGKYADIVTSAACAASDTLAPWLVKSVVERLSYDKLERMWDLGKIERAPVGRSDFYAYRRKFYYNLDVILREGAPK